MRIISGKYKSRRFQLPTHFKGRPTTDFARESLFNILNNWLDWETTNVLDLFSGSGSIALEFVSRGCPYVVSVESDTKNHAFIQKIKEKLDAKEMLVVKADVFSFLKTSNQAFDIIFADPPYDWKDLETVLLRVLESNLLRPDGLFILEHSKKDSFKEHPLFKEERKYGKVRFSIFEKERELRVKN